ncbi:MAG: 2Fe-2S iron-sulfur cluster-binding protein, partial [Candidatus Bathyarchaeia archaeon]
MNKDAVLRIYRHDPTRDAEGRFETYSVPHEEGLSVLVAIHHIQRRIDPTLAAR